MSTGQDGLQDNAQNKAAVHSTGRLTALIPLVHPFTFIHSYTNAIVCKDVQFWKPQIISLMPFHKISVCCLCRAEKEHVVDEEQKGGGGGLVVLEEEEEEEGGWGRRCCWLAGTGGGGGVLLLGEKGSRAGPGQGGGFWVHEEVSGNTQGSSLSDAFI